MSAERIPSSPSRAIRQSEVRRTNAEESPKTGNAAEAWTSGDADLTAEAGSDYGPKLPTAGYERIHLALDVNFGDVGNDHANVFIAAQGSNTGRDGDEHWYDLHTDEAGDGVLVRKVWQAPLVTGASAHTRIAWHEQRRVWKYMRFKVWTDGATRTDSRATLRAARVMDSM